MASGYVDLFGEVFNANILTNSERGAMWQRVTQGE